MFYSHTYATLLRQTRLPLGKLRAPHELGSDASRVESGCGRGDEKLTTDPCENKRRKRKITLNKADCVT